MKKIFLIAAAALAFAACDNNEDNTDTSPVAAKIHATIGESATSRTVNNNWKVGDKIGISSTVGGVAGPYINVEYTVEQSNEDGSGEFTGDKLYFYKPMVLTAYYPFTGEEKTAPGPRADGIIEANTGSDNQKPENIDFLWDSQTGFTAADPNVNFTFAHKMSKVTFIFLDSPELRDVNTGILLAGPVNVSDMVRYELSGLVLDGTFNTNTGECAVKPDASAEPLAIEVTDVTHNKAVPPLILFPQTLTEGSSVLDIYTNELKNDAPLQHYKCTLTFSNGEIKAGYHYIYTIKVTKTGLIVGKMTVEPWEEENRYMTATIDGDKGFENQE